ncbi:hypothetical protein [Alicyclobacillus fodiniaquatilis]|uniref:N-acetyltransferase domain-containing protein n=1 Tax=Alicyclobacillus fodiniaquatilis TaxID=1661150 RepID=A0ABW4JKD1_9BACL
MSEFTLRWLPDKRMYRELRRIAKSWPQHQQESMDNLGLILYETWSAVQRWQPFPSVCVLSCNDECVGVLCGFLWPRQGAFRIQHIVIAQPSRHDREQYREIQHKLVEAAIDFSQENGYHGWVSCAPEEKDAPMWTKLGFRLDVDGLTYRRMGYFAGL